MNLYRQFFFAFGVLMAAVVALQSCLPDEPCTPKMADATFAVREPLMDGSKWPLTAATDTFYEVSEIVCMPADTTADLYRWTLPGQNDELVHEGRNFVVQFMNAGQVTVQLVTGRADPCNEGLMDYDTTRQRLTFMPRVGKVVFQGIYEGYNTERPSHRFRVQIIDFGWPDRGLDGTQGGLYGIRLVNLPEGCMEGRLDLATGTYVRDTHAPEVLRYSYREFFFRINSDFGCMDIRGYGHGALSVDRQRLDLSYYLTESDEPRKLRLFRGQRVY